MTSKRSPYGAQRWCRAVGESFTRKGCYYIPLRAHQCRTGKFLTTSALSSSIHCSPWEIFETAIMKSFHPAYVYLRFSNCDSAEKWYQVSRICLLFSFNLKNQRRLIYISIMEQAAESLSGHFLCAVLDWLSNQRRTLLSKIYEAMTAFIYKFGTFCSGVMPMDLKRRSVFLRESL